MIRNELSILVPEDVNDCPVFQNIKLIKYGKNKGKLWEQIDYAFYLFKNKKEGIVLTNEVPLLYPKGIVCLHDISYKVNPPFFNYFKGRLSVIWHKINYFSIIKSKMRILTVSEFSKREIERVYHVKNRKIDVINNSWQHMNDIRENDVLAKYGFLKDHDYYFSMSTLAANKNFKWVLYAAYNNPNYEFAIAGGGKLRGVAEEMGFADLPNVHFLGYVSDEDAKGLMHHCKAFLFPTLYEGFGIPPLEAVACGCEQIIISDIPVMHEIYGDYANYIDPYNYEKIDLDIFDKKENLNELLDRYSWKESAGKIYKVLGKTRY